MALLRGCSLGCARSFNGNSSTQAERGRRVEPWYPETHRERAACRLLQSSARLITRSPFAADLQEQINQSARLDEILLLLCPFLATSFIIFIIHLQGTGINYANEFTDFADYFICCYCLWKFNY